MEIAIRQLFFLASATAAAATALACSLVIGGPYSSLGAGERGAGAGGCWATAAVPSPSTQLIPSAMKKRVRMQLSPAGFLGRGVMMLSKSHRHSFGAPTDTVNGVLLRAPEAAYASGLVRIGELSLRGQAARSLNVPQRQGRNRAGSLAEHDNPTAARRFRPYGGDSGGASERGFGASELPQHRQLRSLACRFQKGSAGEGHLAIRHCGGFALSRARSAHHQYRPRPTLLRAELC